jgi:hypothetical protein
MGILSWKTLGAANGWIFQVVAVEDRLDSEDLVSESCVREPLVLFSPGRMVLRRFPYFLSIF